MTESPPTPSLKIEEAREAALEKLAMKIIYAAGDMREAFYDTAKSREIAATFLEEICTPPSTAGWLPISTAPKDGSLFLAACPYLYKQTEERWDVHAIRIDENYDPPQLDDDCYQGWDLDAYTHWQPLPAPPAPSQEGASEGEGEESTNG